MSMHAASATAPKIATEITEHVREHYDGLAWLYRAFWGDYLHHGLFSVASDPHEAQLALLDYCVGLLPSTNVRRLLDAGCGYGATTLYLARRLRCPADGVSISPRQISYARQLAERARLDGRLNFTAGDIAGYSYPNSPYDLIWAMESTEHFPDKTQFFNSAANALSRGGVILVAAWTAGTNASASDVARVAEASVCPAFLTASEYQQLMSNAGLNVIAAHDITSDVARTWDIVESRVRWVRPFVRLLPRTANEFSRAIPLIRDSFKSGVLTYNVMVAQR